MNTNQNLSKKSLSCLSVLIILYFSLIACQDAPTDPSTLNPMGSPIIGGTMQGGYSSPMTAGDSLIAGNTGGESLIAGQIAGEDDPMAGAEPNDLEDMLFVSDDMYQELVDMDVTPADMYIEPIEPDMMSVEPIMLPDHCNGPLELPIDSCRPALLPSTGDLYEDCVRRVNQLRAECQCLPPLERWVEGESCADQHAEYDAMTNQAHNGFREGICQPSGRGQNECPGYQSEGQVISLCLQQMWDEGPGEPFSAHGHYINMTNPSHQRVACGFYTTSQGRVWAIQNYSP